MQTLHDVIASGKHVVGLCAGRHPLPVDEYIYEEVKDVLDFARLLRLADKYVYEHCCPRNAIGSAINGNDLTETKIVVGEPLNVIVTGLTPCTTAVMYTCACYGVDLTLWHYDRDADDYKPQSFRFAITPQ